MSDTIRFDDQMLNEVAEIMNMLGEVTVCQAYIQKFLAAYDHAYEGEATELLQQYYTALNAHLTSLQMFYGVAVEFMLDSFLTMHGLDESLGGFF